MSDGEERPLYIAVFMYTQRDALDKQLPYTEGERDVTGTDYARSQRVHQVLVFMGTWRAKATHSSPVGSVGRLLPISAVLRDFGDSFLVDVPTSDHNAVPSVDSRQVFSMFLGSSRAQ